MARLTSNVHLPSVVLAAAGSVTTGFLMQGLLVISGPLVARLLGVEGRGHLAALVLWPIVIANLGNLGLPAALTFYVASNPASGRRTALRALAFALPLAALLTLLHATVLVVYVSRTDSSLSAPDLLTLAGVPATLALQFGLAILQGQQRYRAYSLVRLSTTLVYVAGIVSVFVTGSSSLLAIVAIWVLSYGSLGMLAIAIGLSGPRTSHEGDSVPFATLLRFGLRGLFGRVSPIETLRLDQVALALFLSARDLGLYAAGLAFLSLLSYTAESLGIVAYPRLAATKDVTKARRLVILFTVATGLLSLTLAVPLLISLGTLIRLFFGADFVAGVTTARILVVGGVVCSVRRMLIECLRGLGHPGLGTACEVMSWLSLVPLLVVLVPKAGAQGIAAACGLSYSFSLLFLIALCWVRWRSSTTLKSETPLSLGFENP